MADSAVGAVQVAKGAVAEKRAAAVVAERATARVLAAETVMVVGERVAAATATGRWGVGRKVGGVKG